MTMIVSDVLVMSMFYVIFFASMRLSRLCKGDSLK